MIVHENSQNHEERVFKQHLFIQIRACQLSGVVVKYIAWRIFERSIEPK